MVDLPWLGLACTVAFVWRACRGSMRYATAFHRFAGGFSTRNESLKHYDSSAVEMVGGIFSILAAVNFSRSISWLPAAAA